MPGFCIYKCYTRFWICLNMVEKCLKKLFWLWQGSKYVWSKFHRLLIMPPVLNARPWNMARFWICKGYTRCSVCLNKPEYAFKIPQYAWLCLNNAEYAWIYLNKYNFEYARILNVSDAVHSLRSLYKSLSNYRDRGVFRRCQTFKMECPAKRIMPEPRHAIRNFSEKGSSRRTRALQQAFRQKHKTKKAPQGNILKFLHLYTIKTTFWIENLSQRWT